MASEQIDTHEVVAKTVAEAMRAAIQAMAAAGNERLQNTGPRLGGTYNEGTQFLTGK